GAIEARPHDPSSPQLCAGRGTAGPDGCGRGAAAGIASVAGRRYLPGSIRLQRRTETLSPTRSRMASLSSETFAARPISSGPMLYLSLLVELLRSRPQLLFWTVTLAQASLWVLVPTLSYSAPPGNVPLVLAAGH